MQRLSTDGERPTSEPSRNRRRRRDRPSGPIGCRTVEQAPVEWRVVGGQVVARGLEAEEVTAVTEPEAADPNPAEPSPGSRPTPRPLALATELPDRVDSWL